MTKSASCPPLFERLQAGLREGIAFARGEQKLRKPTLPAKPPALDAAAVLRLRQRLEMTQGAFSQLLNVSVKTVQSWEQGERLPSQAALRLLQLLDANPEVVCDLVGWDLKRS